MFTAFAVARYNTDGSLDSTFGGTGKILTPVGGVAEVHSTAIQADGKIVVAGQTIAGQTSSFGVARYNTDGSPDTTFGDGTGKVSVHVGGNGTQEFARSVAIQTDGKIIVAGEAGAGGTGDGAKFALVRFNLDGTLDTSFGGTGIVLTRVTNISFDYGYSAAIQADGKIVFVGRDQNPDGSGSRHFAVLRFNANTAVRRAQFDFDGDGKSDISVFRPATGAWYLQQSQNGFTGISFGQSGDQIAPADFDGDGKTDVAVFRNGSWYYLKSSNNAFVGVSFGQAGDLPRPADFDGDGKADINVFRPSNGAWYRLNSSNNQFVGISFGQNGDVPLIADFDGDNKSDIAIFRPANGTFYSLDSSTGAFRGTAFGVATDIPTAGDFDGDGKTDIAVFRPTNGAWYRYNSSTGAFVGISFGQSGDLPVAADYDGDGKTDIAVFRSSVGAWYRLNSANGAFVGLSFGNSTDKPIPGAFLN